ncbi:MAG TPA: 50S ribosomal protein L10 [Solirubrobacteraceae bacterium]|nr:50S ribosomal protein L10 [Solirubrobacteraceae bacterium]
MNRDQKAAVIDEIAAEITESQAVYAVDYRGMSVPQAAEVRAKLRDAGTTFRVVKNSLTERAADKAGVETLKDLLEGPTALAFVRGDAAAAAKALSDFARATDLAPFKGGLMNGAPLDVDQIKSIARLPAREVLYGQLVGIVASPITGLARGLNALLSGVAIALGQVHEKALAGEIALGGGAGEAPAEAEAPAEPEAAAEAPAQAEETTTTEEAEADEPAATAEEPADAGAEETTSTEDTQEGNE